MELFVMAAAASVALLAAFGLLLRAAARRNQDQAVNPNWAEEFSETSYRPMERLLSEEDIRFLRTQPGYQPKVERRLRVQRRKIFRAYLGQLRRDFNRLHLTARRMVLHAPSDQPELAAALMRIKVTFWLAYNLAHVRLLLHALGIGVVDVRSLVTAVEQLRIQVLHPAAARADQAVV